MKPTLEQLRTDWEIAKENLAESETSRDRDYWRDRCIVISEEIDGMDEEG